jgi:transposase
MASSFRISSLVPSGLVVESVIESEDMIKVTARSHASEALCPSCGSISRQVHSRYIRQVSDLPCAGRRVALSLIARLVAEREARQRADGRCHGIAALWPLGR